jgi:glutamine amidotransferase
MSAPARAVIVDYGMGNLRSVANAVSSLGAETVVASSPSELERASHVILPGVGAFGDGIEKLRRGGWIAPLDEAVRGRRLPFLGICLGMQLLATSGTEHGTWDGLGWIPGTVTRVGDDDPSLRIPHIGWNDVEVAGAPRLFAGFDPKQVPCFYFVHSYALVPADRAVATGLCTYGAPFVATVEHGNIHGVQFHPEKSHKLGLALLRNFLALEAPC